MTELDEMIWLLVAAIPEGKVSTYGRIATLAGFPNHARYVGTVLRKLPRDSSLPWHRVINAKGELSFPNHTDKFMQQKRLLEAEGILFNGNRVSLRLYSD